MLKLSRRGFLTGLGLLGLSPTVLPACDSDTAPKRPKTTQKDVHLHLVDLAQGKGHLAGAKRVELRVGTRIYPVQEHTAESRARFASDALATATGTATHFAENARFSGGGVQSYSVYRINQNGTETLVCGGIHVPTLEDRKRAETGDGSTGDDPTLQVTWRDAAMWLVFHNPSIMSLDPDMAKKVVTLIGGTPITKDGKVTYVGGLPRFEDLVTAVGRNFHAATPEEAEQFIGGWVIGAYRKAPDIFRDTNVFEVNAQGQTIAGEDGSPRRVVDWNPSRAVEPILLAVIDDVIEAFHNDADFEGAKYFSYEGSGSRVQAQGIHAHANEAESESFFKLSEANKVTEHRSLSVEYEDKKFVATLNNWLALGSMFGVSHFSSTGELLGSTTLGYVESTYYPSLVTAFGKNSKGESTFTVPPDVSTTKLWTAAPCAHIGNLGAYEDKISLRGPLIVAGIISGICDLFVPAVMLSLGLHESTHAREELLSFARKELLKDTVVEELKTAVFAILNVTEGANVGGVAVEFISGSAKVFIHIVEKLLAGVLSSAAGYGLAKLFAELMAEAGAETVAVNAVPFVGWAMYAVNVASSIAQLTMSTVHLASSTAFTHATIQYTHPLELTLKPADESPYFPSYAKYCRVTISPRGQENADSALLFERIEVVQAVASGAASVSVSIEDVPLNAPCTVHIEFLDRFPSAQGAHLVGDLSYAYDNTKAKSPGEKDELDLDVEIIPPAVSETVLQHEAVLSLDSRGARVWNFQNTPPPATGDALSCTDSATGGLCGLNGISVRQSGSVGKIAYNYDTTYVDAQSLVQSPMMADITMPMASAPIPKRTVTAPSARGAKAFLYGLSGARMVITQSAAGAIELFRVMTSHADEVDLGAPDSLKLKKFATSNSTVLRSARLNAEGSHVLLASERGVEIFNLHTSVAPEYVKANVLYRRGSRQGQVLSPVAVAPFQRLDQFAVLDDGNRRVEIFDFEGNRVDYFAKPWLPLAGAGTRTYLDLDVDAVGNIWVLSKYGSEYLIDVYSREGNLIRTTNDVRAGRFALDRYSQVFTLNVSALRPGSSAPEPTVSRWIPTYAT